MVLISLCPVSYKGLVAEALRQLVGEQNYKQDEVLAPGYYTGTTHGVLHTKNCSFSSLNVAVIVISSSPDFVLWMDSSGRVLPIRTGAGLAFSIIPPSCVTVATKPADGSVAMVTSEFQKFSPFATLEEGAEQPCQVGEALGGAMEPRSFLPHHIRGTAGATAASGPPRPGTNGGPLDYGHYYVPPAEYYSSLAKEHSLESQDSSTLSSPPSDSLAQPGTQGPAGAAAPDSLFQFSIGKILEDEGGTGTPGGQGTDCELPEFYEDVTYSEGSGADRGPPSPPQLHAPDRPDADNPLTDQRQIRRSVQLM